MKISITATCNCHKRWGQWGNPYGDEDCSIHGVFVRDAIASDLVAGAQWTRPEPSPDFAAAIEATEREWRERYRGSL